jgi:hypothetical protein
VLSVQGANIAHWKWAILGVVILFAVAINSSFLIPNWTNPRQPSAATPFEKGAVGATALRNPHCGRTQSPPYIPHSSYPPLDLNSDNKKIKKVEFAQLIEMNRTFVRFK